MPEKEKNGKLKKLGRVLSGKDYVLGNERVAKIANKKAKKLLTEKEGQMQIEMYLTNAQISRAKKTSTC